MGNIFYFTWEVSVIEWLQATLGQVGLFFSSLFTTLGNEAFMILLLGFLYWCLDKQLAKKIGISLALGLLCAPMLKNLLLRQRPYLVHPTVACLKLVESGDILNSAVQGFSFPSMHSCNAILLYGSLALHKRKPWLVWLSILMPLCVGLSRIHLGVHYPTDVLAGWAVGMVALWVGNFLCRNVHTGWRLYSLPLLLGLPGWFFCKSEDFYTCYGIVIALWAGFLFEERFVHFENTKNILRCILRPLGGFVLFILLSQGLKLPFSAEFLAEASVLSHAVRCLRYALTGFLLLGVYPLVFAKVDRLYSKRRNG